MINGEYTQVGMLTGGTGGNDIMNRESIQNPEDGFIPDVLVKADPIGVRVLTEDE